MIGSVRLSGGRRDRVRAEVLDSLDFGCERVDYGPAGRIGRLRPKSGHGRGDHLHLSWMHSAGRRFRPVRTVWVWQVRR